MENTTIAGDWLTPKIAKMLNKRMVQVIRNGFGEVTIIIIKGQIQFIKAAETDAVNVVESGEKRMK